MLGYPRRLQDILSDSYRTDYDKRMFSGDGSDIEICTSEFILRDGDKAYRKEYDSTTLEKGPKNMSRFHTYWFESGKTKRLGLLEIILPENVKNFSKGDDTDKIGGYIIPIVIMLSSYAIIKSIETDGNPGKLTEKELEDRLIDFYKSQKTLLSKIYVYGKDSDNGPFTKPDSEYIIPNLLVFPDKTSICLHIHTETTKKGMLMNMVEHVVYGSKAYNQNWDTAKSAALDAVNDILEGGPNTKSGSYKYLDVVKLPKDDDSWRPEV